MIDRHTTSSSALRVSGTEEEEPPVSSTNTNINVAVKQRARPLLSKKQRQRRSNLVAYSFIAPNFLGFVIFTLGPILFAFALAFMHWDGSNPIQFAGLDNFFALFHDSAFQAALWNTLIYTAFSVPLTLAAALGVAVLLNEKIIGRNFFRTAMFFPYVASLVAVAVVWNMLFNPAMGPVNMLLYTAGVDPQSLPGWAADSSWAMVTVIFFGVWKDLGYFMVIYLAGLQGINGDLYEAADLDGASSWQKFWHITVPQLAPTTFFVSVMLTIQSFKVFDQIFMITQGGPGTSTLVLVYHIYNEAFISWDLGYASMVAMVLFLIVLAVTVVQFRFTRED
ncbi:sugar ABC transporter permease [Rhodobacteraceae bacterium]|nr:sugar ABC transporter permease [Paracoccaceae bacterium]